MFITCNAIEERTKEVWYSDKDYHNHMSSDRDIFINIYESIKSKVKLRNNLKRSNYEGK